MAEAVLKIKAREEISNFAREIIRTQGAEISQMQSLLEHSNINQDHH
jgi:uncharacterized protein (DUF305 family)